jgi:hypothetical protein
MQACEKEGRERFVLEEKDETQKCRNVEFHR